MEIVLDNCEPTNEIVWYNIKTIDRLYKLDLMMMVIESYYKLNNNKNPKDLELELRDHNVNVGLIATKVADDKTYQELIDTGKGIVIKRKYRHLYTNKSLKNINHDHIAEYYTLISCRPREYVIEETLKYNSSIEENLNKLEDAGDFVLINNEISEGDTRIPQTDDIGLLQDGKKKVVVREVNLEEMFKKTYEKYPSAKTAIYSMLSDGTPLYVLINDNKIVCPIGMNIYIENNEEKIKYLPIS